MLAKVLPLNTHRAAAGLVWWLGLSAAQGRGAGARAPHAASLEAPADSPFAGGVFALVVTLPPTYPAQPPTILFETPIHHCNVSEEGQICLDLIREKWSDAFSVPKALEAVRLMMSHPDPEQALRQWIAELTIAHKKSGGKDTRYADAAAQHTRKNAARGVAEWMALWGC